MRRESPRRALAEVVAAGARRHADGGTPWARACVRIRDLDPERAAKRRAQQQAVGHIRCGHRCDQQRDRAVEQVGQTCHTAPSAAGTVALRRKATRVLRTLAGVELIGPRPQRVGRGKRGPGPAAPVNTLRSMKPEERLAVIDLGSNSFRLVVFMAGSGLVAAHRRDLRAGPDRRGPRSHRQPGGGADGSRARDTRRVRALL